MTASALGLKLEAQAAFKQLKRCKTEYPEEYWPWAYRRINCQRVQGRAGADEAHKRHT